MRLSLSLGGFYFAVLLLVASGAVQPANAAPIPIGIIDLGSFNNLWNGVKTHIRNFFGPGTSYKSAKVHAGQLEGENTRLLDGQNTEQLEAQKAHLGPLVEGGDEPGIIEKYKVDFSKSVDSADSELRKMALDIAEKKNDEAQIALKTYEDALPAKFEHVFKARLKLFEAKNQLQGRSYLEKARIEQKLKVGNTKLNALIETLRESFTNAHFDRAKKAELLTILDSYQFKIRNGHFPEKPIVDVLYGINYFHPSPKAL
ncbi:hypothetical protein ACQY0O_005545 [Thecaphora frezii]